MKLSFSTLSFDEYTFKDLAEICNKYGYGGLEIRIGSGVGRKEYSKEDLVAVRQMLDSYDVCVVSLGSSVCACGYSEKDVSDFKKLLPMAQILGAKGIRIFTGYFKNLRSQITPEIDYNGLVKAICEMCDAAREYGVCVYIETHNDFSTGNSLKKLAGDVGRENCKIIWDIMHPIEENEKPYDTLSYLKNLVAHVHIKDGVKAADHDIISYTYCKIGEGEMPVKEVVKLLREGGYDGYYSLEWEQMWRDSLKKADIPHDEVLKQYSQFMRDINRQIDNE